LRDELKRALRVASLGTWERCPTQNVLFSITVPPTLAKEPFSLLVNVERARKLI
jgi:hypothetical protein